jgi:hypothetical protein
MWILYDYTCVGNIRGQIGNRRKSGAEAGAFANRARHRLGLWTCFLPSLEGEGKSRLGGELRREYKR